MCNLKVIRQLLAHAKTCERQADWNMAVIAYKELVNVCRYTVNDSLTSPKVKHTVMEIAQDSIKRCEMIENYNIFNSECIKDQKEKAKSQEVPINVPEKLKEYFASEKGKRHNPEQIKCIQNIALLVSVTKPSESLDDVFGLEGELNHLFNIEFFFSYVHYLVLLLLSSK